MRTSILLGKAIIKASRVRNRPGSTWPGHIALKVNPNIIKKFFNRNPNLKIILIAGTNGKTTTAKFTQDILEANGYKVFRNETGANLLNGVVSALIHHASSVGRINYDVAIFEVDENILPIIIRNFVQIKNPVSIILLNLFRDQLDRYGEVNTISKNWLEALSELSVKPNVSLFSNGDDPMLRYISEMSGLKSHFFGIDQNFMRSKQLPHDVDFIFCPRCQHPLTYSKRSYSHMGIYKCPNCGYQHLKTSTFPLIPNPLAGDYNRYNIYASVLCLGTIFKIPSTEIAKKIGKLKPAFGRQEEVIYRGKKIFIMLSKNPTGFNQSINAVLQLNRKPNILLILNDRIPDGRDVSWIWDVDFENLVNSSKITISGDRAYDMALRIKYSFERQNYNQKVKVFENVKEALDHATNILAKNDTLYILATYSAMLDTRRHIKGRSIL